MLILIGSAGCGKSTLAKRQAGARKIVSAGGWVRKLLQMWRIAILAASFEEGSGQCIWVEEVTEGLAKGIVGSAQAMTACMNTAHHFAIPYDFGVFSRDTTDFSSLEMLSFVLES